MVRFINQDEPVLVFTGYILPKKPHQPEGFFQVKLAKDFVVTLPVKIQDFFTFMAAPQYRADVYIAIASAGGNISDVDRMLATDLIRVVSPTDNDVSLDALSGLHLVPIGYKVNLQETEAPSTLVYVGHGEDATKVCPIYPLLASVLWEAEDDEDFPSAVRRLGVEADLRSDVAIRHALLDLDGLLANGLARWENLVEPKQRRQQKVLEEVSGVVSPPQSPLGRIRKFLQLK
jgi:hypothetical protein